MGNLPKQKAEQYLREVMSRYRNKLVYNADTGEIRDDKKIHVHAGRLQEIPRREGGRGTEITTLPGGQNLGELEDVKYFQKKLYRALNVPESRLESDSSFNVGRSAEITRDEVKFQFVVRLRKKFSDLFLDLLKTQLVLKGVFSLDEWDDMKEHIQFDFVADNYFSELKEQEIMNAYSHGLCCSKWILLWVVTSLLNICAVRFCVRQMLNTTSSISRWRKRLLMVRSWIPWQCLP